MSIENFLLFDSKARPKTIPISTSYLVVTELRLRPVPVTAGPADTAAATVTGETVYNLTPTRSGEETRNLYVKTGHKNTKFNNSTFY